MTARGTRPSPAGLTLWVVVFVAVLARSAWRHHDVTIWVLAAAPALAKS